MAKSRGGHFKKNKAKMFARNLEVYGQYTCEYCNRAPLYKNETGNTKMRPDLMTIDHIIPLKLNGSNGQFNMRVSCFECNNKKADRVI